MSANSFGNRLVMHTFGESHGPAMGVIIDGCPAGLEFPFDLIKKNLNRRRPGSSAIVTNRNESDDFEILSGIYNNLTLGTPICVVVHNKDFKSDDYLQVKTQPRLGHADETWLKKFGIHDHRGGGRSSGRETLSRVIAGTVAEALLKTLKPDIEVYGFAESIGSDKYDEETLKNFFKRKKSSMETSHFIDEFPARFPHFDKSFIEKKLLEVKNNGNSLGGVVQLVVKNCFLNLGQPVFHKLKSDLTMAMMSIGATIAVELGSGVSSTNIEGAEFHTIIDDDTDPYGGINGGISNGKDIILKIHFKPTSSILDVAKKGRHDPCIVPRAIPVIESMVWFVLADHLLWSQTDQIQFIKGK